MSVYSLIKYNRIIQKSFILQFSKLEISNEDICKSFGRENATVSELISKEAILFRAMHRSSVPSYA